MLDVGIGHLSSLRRGLAMNFPKTPFFVRYDERLVYPEPDSFRIRLLFPSELEA